MVAALSAALCAYAVAIGSFWLLVAATVVAGFYSANAALYRFAGPELVAPAFKEKAISLVLAGGIVGAFIGPNLASATRGWLAVPFAGAYLALVAVALLSLVVLSFIRFPAHVPPRRAASGGRPLAELARQPVFIVAVAARGAGLRRDEPADGGHADRHAAVPAPLRAARRWCWSGMCSACSCRASSPAT